MVKLIAWAKGDLPLLRRANTTEMTEHLGGPENAAKLGQRHRRYLAGHRTGKARMFKIIAESGSEPAGIVGYWEKSWRDELIWEAGWSVLTEYQGRGIAKAATSALVGRARLEKRHRFLHAFPAVENGASNGVCRALGFDLVEECEFEYPPGHLIRCNDWRLDLVDRPGSASGADGQPRKGRG
ncbi:MAG: GNAT family N-acetyltransferase [Chloroflexota bacterium]